MIFSPSAGGISHAREEDTAESDLFAAIEAFGALANLRTRLQADSRVEGRAPLAVGASLVPKWQESPHTRIGLAPRRARRAIVAIATAALLAALLIAARSAAPDPASAAKASAAARPFPRGSPRPAPGRLGSR